MAMLGMVSFVFLSPDAREFVLAKWAEVQEYAMSLAAPNQPYPLEAEYTLERSIELYNEDTNPGRLLEFISIPLDISSNENGPVTEETRAMLRLCGTHVIRECAEVTDLAYKIVGSTGIYQENKIQRRFQDMHVITQHVQAREEHFNLVGRYLISNEYERGPMS